jgi:hypothetical protein
MKLYASFTIPLTLASIIVLSCGDESKNKTVKTEDIVTRISDSSTSTIIEAMESIDGTNDSGTVLSFRSIFLKYESAFDKLKHFLRGRAAYAAYQNETVYKDGLWSNASATQIWRYRVFNNCIKGKFTISGSAVHHIWNLQSGTGKSKMVYAQTGGTVHDQAPSGKKMTNNTSGRYIIIEGNGINTSAPEPAAGSDIPVHPFTDSSTISSPASPIAHSIRWFNQSTAAGTKSFYLSVNVTRSGYESSGTMLLKHTVVTSPSSPITVVYTAGSAPTRTINGSISVTDETNSVKIDSAYTNVIFDITAGTIVSGTIAFTVSTTAGTDLGTGTITFSNGTATVTYNGETATYEL